MYKGLFLAIVLAISGMAVHNGYAALAEECGEISIAKSNWASAEILAEIDKLILSAGYGCQVMFLSTESTPSFTSMNETGKPDLIPELWVDSVRIQLNAAANEGRVIIAAEVLSDGGEEGWWIPRYIAEENPEIKTVDDALERPDLFTTANDPEISAIYNCPPDWACRTVMDNLFRALDADDKGFTLVDTGTAAGLDASIARAHEQKSGWLGYYWAPTSMLGRYDMVKLDMGEHDPELWNSCTAVAECAEPTVNGWPSRDVFTIVTAEFANRARIAMDYVNHRQWSQNTVSELLAWMDDNQATSEEVAYHFLENYEPLWSGWIPEDVVRKVKNRL